MKLGKNGVEEVLGFGSLSDYEKEGLEALKSELKSSIEKGITWHSKSKNPTAPSVYEPIKPTFRPLSPHLPIYKPQTSSTVSITNRISAIILTTVPLSYAFLTLKVGPICLANESVYQAMHYASKLGPISLQITALAAVYHLVHGLHDVYLLFK